MPTFRLSVGVYAEPFLVSESGRWCALKARSRDDPLVSASRFSCAPRVLRMDLGTRSARDCWSPDYGAADPAPEPSGTTASKCGMSMPSSRALVEMMPSMSPRERRAWISTRLRAS